MKKIYNKNASFIPDYRYEQQQHWLNMFAEKYGMVAYRPDYHATERDCNTVLIYTKADADHDLEVDRLRSRGYIVYSASEARDRPCIIEDKYIYRDYVCSFENTDCNGRFDLGFANNGSVNLRHYKWPESLEKWLCERIVNSNNPSILTAMRDKALEYLWDELTDVPLNEDEELEKRYLHFPIGTEKEEIWHWFDQKHSKGVYYLLYEREV